MRAFASPREASRPLAGVSCFPMLLFVGTVIKVDDGMPLAVSQLRDCRNLRERCSKMALDYV